MEAKPPCEGITFYNIPIVYTARTLLLCAVGYIKQTKRDAGGTKFYATNLRLHMGILPSVLRSVDKF